MTDAEGRRDRRRFALALALALFLGWVVALGTLAVVSGSGPRSRGPATETPAERP